MTEQQPEQAGYMKNAEGHLVPISQVTESEKLRDEIVKELMAAAIDINRQLAALKKKALDDIATLIEISGDRYGVKLGGEKGNVSLHSFDGSCRILRVYAKNIKFSEEVMAAHALFEKCIEKWTPDTANADQNYARQLINRAFMRSRTDQIKTSALIDLINFKCNDPDWQTGVEALKASMQVMDNTVYVRFYMRDDESESYNPISLDIANVRAEP